MSVAQSSFSVPYGLLIIMINLISSQHFMYIYWDSPSLTWRESNSLCSFSYGSSLASIHDIIQNNEAELLCPDGDLCWIGAYDIGIDNWKWIDDTSFDYGSAWQSPPWRTGEPNDESFTGDEDCAHLWFNAEGWTDNGCDKRDMTGTICNYPQYLRMVNDTINDIRIPHKSYSIGSMDILDEIIVKFSFVIYSWHLIGDFVSLLHIGNDNEERYPAVYIRGDNQYLYVSFSRVNNSNDPGYVGSALSLNKTYYFELYAKQNSLLVKLDEIIIYNQSNLSSHSMLRTSVYLSDNYYDPMDGYLSNLIIETSNSYLDPFNYLCDYYNRFTVISGVWEYNAANCILEQKEDGSNEGTVVWLGDKDTSSLQWTDYKIEVKIKIFSDQNQAGVLIRCKSMQFINNGGECYYIHLHAEDNQVKLTKIYNGSYDNLFSLSKPINYTQDYLVRVEAEGNMFKVYVDNEFIFNYTDNSYSHGSVGFRTWQSLSVYSSLRIIFPNGTPYLIPSNQTFNPTVDPTLTPSINPTSNPSITPAPNPSITPTSNPSITPTYSDGKVLDNTETTIVKNTAIDGKNEENEQFASKTIIIVMTIVIIVLILCIMFLLITVYIKIKQRKKKQNESNIHQSAIPVSQESHSPNHQNHQLQSVELINNKILDTIKNDEQMINYDNNNNNDAIDESEDGDDLFNHTQQTTKGQDMNTPKVNKGDDINDINDSVEGGTSADNDDDNQLYENVNTLSTDVPPEK